MPESLKSEQAAGPPSLIERLGAYYSAAGLTTELNLPTEDAPFLTLGVSFPGIGRYQRIADLQFSLVPLSPELTRGGVQLLQTFVELGNDLKPEVLPELVHLIGRINGRLPIGFFGVFEDPITVYFKQNMFVPTGLEIEAVIRHIDRQSGFVLMQLSLFADAVVEVATGTADGTQALRNASLPEAWLA